MDIKCEIDIKDEPLEGEEYSEADDQIYVTTGLHELQVESCGSVIDIKNEFEIKDEPLDIRMEESKNEETFNQITEIDEKQDLNIGETSEEKRNTFKGNICSESPCQESIEVERTNEKHDWKEFSCLNCNFIFESEDGLVSHLESSCKVKVKCSRCKGNYNCESDFKTCLLNHKNENENRIKAKLFKCFECAYECNQKRYLKRHMLKHQNRKLFKCSDCNYECNQKEHLKRHLLTHGNIKLFKCSECNYECNEKKSLRIHMLKHRNIKLFKCSECNYESNEKGNLNSHLLTHGNIKLFKCSECNYKCNHKGNLKKHLLTHGNVKLFKCSECNYECNRKENLERHLLKHTKYNI